MLTTIRHRLADRLEMPPDDLTRRALDVGPEIIGSMGPNTAALGVRLGGESFGIDLRNNPHAMFVGDSGKGKSTTARTYVSGRLQSRARIILVAGGNKIGNFRFCERQISRTCTAQGITAALDCVVEEMTRRQLEVNDYTTPDGNGVDHYSDIPGNDGPIDLIVEEIASIIGKGNLFSARHREMVAHWFDCFTQIARLGREADVHMIAMAQIGTLISFGTNDASNGIRSSLRARITHDAGRQNIDVITDGLIREVPESILRAMEMGGKGRVAFTGLTAEDSGLGVGQVVPLTQAQARWFAERYEGPEPMQFDPQPTKAKEFHP